MTTNAKEHGFGSLQETDSDVISHAADLFSMPHLENSMVEGRTSTYRPIDKNNDGPYQFIIPPQGMQYVQLAATRLFLRLKIVKEDGTDLVAADEVAPINLIGSSMFRSIDIEIGGTPVPELGNMYSNYKAYLETLLSYSAPAQESHLLSCGWLADTAGKFDITTDDNDGYKRRKAMSALSVSFEVMTPVHCDFLQCDKFLPPGVTLSIKFNRAPDNFALITSTNNTYKIVVEDIKLFVRHITLNSAIVKNHLDKFERQPAVYHMNKTVMKTFVFGAGTQAINQYSIFTEILPKSLIIGMVQSDSFNGKIRNGNPFNFQHFTLSSGNIRVNGESLPLEPYRPDWVNKLYCREYRDFFDNIGIKHNDMGNLITPAYFSGGCFFMVSDLSADQCNGRHYHPRQSGKIDVEILFKTALTQSINLIAFGVFDALVLLDKNNKVTTDISP